MAAYYIKLPCLFDLLFGKWDEMFLYFKCLVSLSLLTLLRPIFYALSALPLLDQQLTYPIF